MSQQVLDSAKGSRRSNRAYDANFRTKQIAAGLCRYCRSPKLVKATVCEQHWFSNVAHKRIGNTKLWSALKEKLEKQNYRCPYTNQILTICVNASLDHIKPTSRFPELSCDLNNVEWVSLEVNYAKRNKTKDEFIAFCKSIAGKADGKETQ